MEINITRFFNEACPRDYSASVAEIGKDAGIATWSAACEDSADYMMLDTEEKREAYRDHARGYGGWEDEEIASWSDVELNALFIQDISAELREFRELANSDWKEWEALCEAGTCSGRLFGGPFSISGEVFFDVGF